MRSKSVASNTIHPNAFPTGNTPITVRLNQGPPHLVTEQRLMAKRFPAIVHEMLSAGHSECGWTTDGASFWITHQEALALRVIPNYSDHSSFASLHRSFSSYGFRKLSSSTWHHPMFRRDRRALLVALVWWGNATLWSTCMRNCPHHVLPKPAGVMTRPGSLVSQDPS
jgi:hypothetical protein